MQSLVAVVVAEEAEGMAQEAAGAEHRTCSCGVSQQQRVWQRWGKGRKEGTSVLGTPATPGASARTGCSRREVRMCAGTAGKQAGKQVYGQPGMALG